MYRLTPEHTKSRIKVLIYGPQGVGKTTFAATAQDHPAMAPVLFLNVEGGLVSIASRGDIDVDDIESTQDFESVFWKLRNKTDEYAKYKTVVIDSVTELQNKNLVEISSGNTDNKDIDEMSQRDYGKSTNTMRRLLRWYRDLPINVVITALPKRIYDKTAKKQEESAPIEVRPSLTDKLCDSVMGYVDFVWYIWAEEENGVARRRILTRDRGIYRAKTRGMRFAESIGLTVEDPTLGSLYDAFCASETINATPAKGGKK